MTKTEADTDDGDDDEDVVVVTAGKERTLAAALTEVASSAEGLV